MLAVAISLSSYVADVVSSHHYVDDTKERQLARGVLSRAHDEWRVRYVHPVTEQRITAPVDLHRTRLKPKPGQRIQVLAENDDPFTVHVPGDKDSATEYWFQYAAIIAVAFLPFAYRRFTVARAERLVMSRATTFAMQGSLFRSRFGRAYLALYALDSAPGASPVCSLRVLSTALAPMSECLFPVEVKGSPRPLGRVVAAYGNGILWPAGPALGPRKRHPRPEVVAGPVGRVVMAADPRRKWRPSLVPFFAVPAVATAAALGLLAIVAFNTLHNAQPWDRISRHGIRAVGTIVRHDNPDGDDDLLDVRYVRGGTTYTAIVGVDFASDYKVGVKYPIRVDPKHSGRARLETEPYDNVEPIVWGALPLFAVLPWLLHRTIAWRRVRRAVQRGPWFRARAALVPWSGRGALLGVFAGEECVAALPIGGAEKLPRDEFDVTLAGDLDVGGAVAAWWRGDAIAPSAPATIAEARPRPFVPVTYDGAPPPPERRRIVLKSFRLARRKPTLDVVGHEVTLMFGKFFTGPWVFDARDVAAIDTTRELAVGADEPDLGIRVPALNMIGRTATPNLTLLFKSPQRLPRLRLLNSSDLPWSYWKARSAEGEHADGISLRAADPRGAIETLAAAGAAVPEAPLAWLRSVRPELWAPAYRADVRRRRKRASVLSGVGMACFAGTMVPLVLLGDQASNLVFALVFAPMIAGTAFMVAAQRLRRRAGR